MERGQSAAFGSVQALSYRFEIHPQALEDIAQAAAWYEQQEPGLGERFTREVVAAIDSLMANPFVYRLRNRRLNVRWCFPRRFPYRIVYRVSSGAVSIVAVINAARHDRQWRERL